MVVTTKQLSIHGNFGAMLQQTFPPHALVYATHPLGQGVFNKTASEIIMIIIHSCTICQFLHKIENEAAESQALGSYAKEKHGR